MRSGVEERVARNWLKTQPPAQRRGLCFFICPGLSYRAAPFASVTSRTAPRVASTKPSAPVLAGPISLKGGPLFLGRLKFSAHLR